MSSGCRRERFIPEGSPGTGKEEFPFVVLSVLDGQIHGDGD